MAYEPRLMEEVLADVGKPVTVSRRATQESLDASRKMAAGAPTSNRGRNPEFAAWANAHINDVIGRTVMGPPYEGGNATFYTLSHEQFAEHQATGMWTGMPTEEEMNVPDPKPENKEWTPL